MGVITLEEFQNEHLYDFYVGTNGYLRVSSKYWCQRMSLQLFQDFFVKNPIKGCPHSCFKALREKSQRMSSQLFEDNPWKKISKDVHSAVSRQFCEKPYQTMSPQLF